jgi:Sigma-70 region 2
LGVVGRRNANCPPSETARLRLEAIARGPLADRLRASLRRRHPHCSADEVAEASQEAYLRALRACPVEDEAAVYAWLRRTMDNVLVDRMRLLSHEAPVSDAAGVFVRASNASADPERVTRCGSLAPEWGLFRTLNWTLTPKVAPNASKERPVG